MSRLPGTPGRRRRRRRKGEPRVRVRGVREALEVEPEIEPDEPKDEADEPEDEADEPEDEADEPEAEEGEPRLLQIRRLGTVAPVVGMASLLFMIWGLVFRRDVWEARSFVLLYYVAAACAIASISAQIMLRRAGRSPVPSFVRDIRGGLVLLVVVGVVWVWLPFISRPLVGWLLRLFVGFRFF